MFRKPPQVTRLTLMIVCCATITSVATTSLAGPLGTEFTYQGRLNIAGEPLNDSADFEFTLWDADIAGNMIGAVAVVDNVLVVDGLFAAELDFGSTAFNGDARWLEIAVRTPHDGTDTAPFTTLSPRQSLTATPYGDGSGLTNLSVVEGVWNESGADIYYNDGNVGVGTDSPSALLQLSGGDLRLDHANTVNTTRAIEIRGSRQGGNAPFARIDFWNLDSNDANQDLLAAQITSNNSDLTDSGDLRFFTTHDASFFGLDERMRITETGDVGIGTINPANLLSVGGNADFSGAVGINTSNPSFDLHVNGTAGKPGGGTWSTASDVRLKKNIAPLSGALDTLLNLHGVTFEYKDSKSIGELGGVRTGFIAQEVEQVIPDWVEENADGYKVLTIRGFEAMSVESFREISNQNEELRAELEALRNEMADMKASINALTNKRLIEWVNSTVIT